MAEWLPPDQNARDRIVAELNLNLLVEAGAGSGKTTAMVQRMVALIVTGATTIDQLVAVTFTRKAAAELRERFQERLEDAFRSAADGSIERQRTRTALDQLDSCFLGTIHAFCARLLRERPLEAGISPDFREIYGAEEELLRTEVWNRFLERLAGRQTRTHEGSRLLAKLLGVGIAPRQLFGLFTQMAENGDLRFPVAPVAAPSEGDLVIVCHTLERLLMEANRLMPRREPEHGWDQLQKRVRFLRMSRDERKWDDRTELLNAAAEVVFGNKSVTLNRWTGDKRHFGLLKDLEAEWAALDEPTEPVRRITLRWLAHRYAVVIRFARAAGAYYARERIRRGRLTFQDLLLRTAALLRDNPTICAQLGERYRYLLIDEFQDTDPVQAEVLFRLAAAQPSTTRDWLSLRPRAGALFVVGDPKQSIYRFRRADIALYLQVKHHFRDYGDVVELTANFRSTGRIGDFVNRAFQTRFPETDDPGLHQATYAPVLTNPAKEKDGRVAWYRFDADSGRGWKHIARPDAARIAPWIRQRIDAGERRPQDFLILTRTRHELARFAHALERENVPYEISGAGIGMEEELRELILLLEALADPGNPVLTLAVLEGLFFGIDHDTLHEHAIRGGHFHLLSKERKGTLVDDALDQLQRMWELTRIDTADVAIPLIVDELGILPYAAGGELGATRAGALLFALDVLRQGSLVGRTTLADAIALLETALTRDDSEAPLRPGALNVVRVMNLHRAKGLEAAVVILANPIEATTRSPSIVQRRLPDGSAEGWFAVFDSTSSDRRKPIARPLHWDALEAEEGLYQQAEEDRLMYVAATRAAQELIIARCEKMDEKSVWKCFHELLDHPARADALDLAERQPDERVELNAGPEALRQQIMQLRLAREQQRRPSYRAESITERLKPEDVPRRRGRYRPFRALQLSLGLDAPPNAQTFGHDREGKPIFQLGLPLDKSRGDGTPPLAIVPEQVAAYTDAGGADWGSAVHSVLQAAARGLDDEALHVAAHNALLLADCPTDTQGQPLWLDELIRVVETMRASELWQRAQTAQRVLYEVPFELKLSADDWAALSNSQPAGLSEIVSGRIDLAFEDHDGWIIADYKTDVADPKVLRARAEQYRRQIEVYAACWTRITGMPVKERQIVFTAPGVDAVVW